MHLVLIPWVNTFCRTTFCCYWSWKSFEIWLKAWRFSLIFCRIFQTVLDWKERICGHKLINLANHFQFVWTLLRSFYHMNTECFFFENHPCLLSSLWVHLNCCQLKWIAMHSNFGGWTKQCSVKCSKCAILFYNKNLLWISLQLSSQNVYCIPSSSDL